jgi:hypothetical protein
MESERRGAVSDAPLPNNEAAKEHLDSSQFASRIVNFGRFSRPRIPFADAEIRGGGGATYRQLDDQTFSEALPLTTSMNVAPDAIHLAHRLRSARATGPDLTQCFAWKSLPLPDKNRKLESYLQGAGEKGGISNHRNFRGGLAQSPARPPRPCPSRKA